MIVKKENNERLFWILQIVGWLTYDSLNLLGGYAFSTTYMIYSYLVYTVVGIVLSSMLRWYLKRYVKIDWYGKSDVLHLIMAVSVSILSFLGSAYVLEYIYESFWERTEAEIAYFEQFTGIGLILLSTSVTVVGWTTIYYAVKIYMQRGVNHKEQLELRATLKEAQLNTLKGQVNPHFMFNSLNNIRGLMLEDVGKSKDMITKLSEMLEFALVKNNADVISMTEEIEMVRNYIALSKIQMEDRLQFVEEVDHDTLQISIPPMIIQLLVENATKHGIANLKEGGVIQLKTEKSTNELSIKVSNTGKLSIAKDSTQLGLKNIRQRLKLVYGVKASFAIEEIENEVVAEIKIPLA